MLTTTNRIGVLLSNFWPRRWYPLSIIQTVERVQEILCTIPRILVAITRPTPIRHQSGLSATRDLVQPFPETDDDGNRTDCSSS